MENQRKIDKEFKLTTWAVNNTTTVLFLTFIIVIMGVGTYIALPKENFPEIKIPKIYIGTTYPGNSPKDIENLITRPIEKELNTISTVDNIQSTSIQDYSTIVVEFTTNTDVEDALTKVKDAVDKAKPELPTDLDRDPNIFEIDVNEFPILNINLSGNYSVDQLKEYAEYLEDEIEKLSEISKAEIRGVDEKEVKIKADPFKMEAMHINFGDIENAVSSENVTMSSGNYKSDGVERSVRIDGEFKEPEELLNIVVKHEEGNIVYLKDIATVQFDYKDKANFARLNSKPVVMVDVVKRSGENLLIATEKIGKILEKAESDYFPKDLEVIVTNDQSQQTKEMVSNLENSIVFGVILVVTVLLFFLGTRNALFVGMAIPLSMFMSFLILGLMGININMMVLFGLIMALGMLVDNGIVVVENVYRLMEQGYSPIQATRMGVGEVALPIISSTATTLAAFLPLAFWPGIMGDFMKYLPYTLIITLGSSLFVALVINPAFIKLFMRVDDRKKIDNRKVIRNFLILTVIGVLLLVAKINVFGNLVLTYALMLITNIYVLTPMSRKFQDSFLPWLEVLYERTVRLALRKSYLFFFGTVGLLFLSIIMLGAFAPKVIFFPINEPKYINVFVEFPIGTDIEKTNGFTLEIENKVEKLIQPYHDIVESVITNVGQGASDPNDPASIGQGDTPNKSRITINFVEMKDRMGIKTSDVMEELRDAMKGYPGVTITVDKDAAGPPVGKPISIEVTGDDYATLTDVTDRMKQFINESGIDGIEKLKTDLETGKPELIVNIDRDKARRFGVSTFTIANELRTAIFGKEISKYKKGEDDYEIQLRLNDKYRYDVDALVNKNITFRDQTSGKMHQVPISSLATEKLSSTFGSIRRKDLKRMITISSNVEGGYNATEVNNQIKAALQDFEMPKGYEYKFGGEQEKQSEEMAFLSEALMVAVFLIFLIIVGQFNKITAPVIIMTSVLFSTIGVFMGLVTFHMDFIIMMTMIGIISLAGIVVNNAIVLIDFIELTRKRKREELGVGQRLPMSEIVESIIMAGKTRLRPVLLTAITTILGLIPLATGMNIDFIQFFQDYNPDFFLGGDSVIFWGPMSWTIIFGLTFATFLTLVIVPVMYLFFDKVMYWFADKKEERENGKAEAVA
ncbi:MAG: efflux RND transporter permease subunit [Cyclobacteriaceae bacterium]|nr:efflux RND transporter permease subunit [Cyclobacteriaceae bacterium]